jgi:hypothetical protein
VTKSTSRAARHNAHPGFDPAFGVPGDRVRYGSQVGSITDAVPASPSLRRVRFDGGEMWLHASQFVLVERGRAA